VATAATQIEDLNPHTDWHTWTAPAPEGLGKGVFVGEAVKGYTKALDDVALVAEMGLDAYRFSVEWARVEPRRGEVSEEALAHYDAVVSEVARRGLMPIVSVLHFSNPLWVDDPRDASCAAGPTDEHLCGWDSDEGAARILESLRAHARRLGARYGDRVDHWGTVNEPINYLIAAYGAGQFPPGKRHIPANMDRLVAALRNYLRAHVAIYDGLKEGDAVDADGDGVAASVGLTLSVADWVPARDNAPSALPDDVSAAARVRYVYHELFPASLLDGAFDADFDGRPDEQHPDWRGKVDWLGAQYYFRAGVTGKVPLIPLVRAAVCFGGFDLGACLAPEDPTHWVPAMSYEFYAPGLYAILKELSARFPALPLAVTESGLATEVGRRRAEHIARSLEQIWRAREEGVDVRAYLHWSLTDNFEWAEGFEPRFGLYRVDYEDPAYPRAPTEGADLLRDVARARALTGAQRAALGGLGPMTEEAGEEP